MKQTTLKNRFLAGFTIIELMLTIAVAAVILTLGVPSFQDLMERNQLTSNINRFISSLALARSESIKRNQRVVVCPSSDGTSCSGTGYDNGWIIFVDTNNNGSRDTSDDEELIWQGESIAAGMTLRGTGLYNSSIPYIPSGRISLPLNGSVRLCIDNDTSRAKMITLIRSGRVHLANYNSQGIPLFNDGNNMPDCAT